MPPGFHAEPLLAIAYAMLLLGIAAFLEWMGKHSEQRSHRYHTAGFQFHKQADHWECPTGERLHRAETDHQLRVIRYRAPAHTCNRCAIKGQCTDSDRGREIAVSIDPWLSSAMGRFHRGLSLVLLILAGLIAAVELIRHDHGTERWLLSAVLFMIALLGMQRVRDLRRTS
jgi:hypothetical protein